MDDKKLRRIFLITISALCFAALIAFIQVKVETSTPRAVVAENFGGPFTLTDHTGKEVTHADYAKSWRLIYFGFTFCPAICPTELGKISKALHKANGPKADLITPIFITVDPQRDTPEVLAPYVEMFHPRLIGLTGTDQQIAQVAKAYKIYYAKVDDPELTEYTMDHSSFIYLINPDDDLISIFRVNDEADAIAETINSTVN